MPRRTPQDGPRRALKPAAGQNGLTSEHLEPESRQPFQWPPVTYWARVAAVVAAIVVLMQVLSVVRDAILVIIASFVFAIGLQPAVERLERHGWSRSVGVGLILAAFGIPVLVLIGLIVPVVVSQLAALGMELPDQLERLRSSSEFFVRIDRQIDVESIVSSLTSHAQTALPGVLRSGAGFVFNLVTVLVLTPYFAVALPRMKLWIVRLFERPLRADILHVLAESSGLVSSYIAGNILISVIAFAVSLVGFWVLDIPYPVALAAWIALTDLIPVVGAALGAAVALMVAGFVGGFEMIATGLFLAAYQQVENYVIAPKVMRRAVNVTPPMVIVALMVGGSLAGFIGALLALPVAAMLKVVVTEFYLRRRIDRVRASNGAHDADLAALTIRPELGRRPLPD